MDTKITFLTPFLKQRRGNSTTAERIVTGLKESGIDVHLFAYEEEEYTFEKIKELQNSSLIHILHISRFLKFKEKYKLDLTKPYILTNGGTDINHDLISGRYIDSYKELMSKAAAITVFTEDANEKVRSFINHGTIVTIPQSVWFPQAVFEGALTLNPGYPNILLPAGLRKVKDVFFLIEELIYLRSLYKNLNFVIVGMVIESEVYDELLAYKKKYPWITFIENVPLEGMRELYNWADIVLNTSISEGQSSSILEALKMNSVVFARRNPGNESVIQDGVTGYLFSSQEEFLHKIKIILENKATQEKVIKAGNEYVEAKHSHLKEIRSYISLYKKILTEE